jgi:N-acetylglucosamine repressor
MTKRKAGNSKFLKTYNQTGILDLIRIHKEISRTELSGMTGLSPTATGMIVSNLIEKGYIRERGTGESKGGRKPVLVELKPRSYYSIGIDMDTNYMRAILVDITGHVVYEKLMNMEFPADFERTAAYVEKTVLDIMREFSVDSGMLLGVGISVPGLVDSGTHEIVLAPNLGWKNADMKSKLAKLSHIPVYVENEAMASAICENWIGACRDVENFVCINVKSGIGAGIFTGGKLYRGASGSAGEIGHITVDENGPLCGCGNYGCLETMASTTRIVEKAKKLVRQGTVSTLNEFRDVEKISIDCIIEAARSGDETARNVLIESARYLGIAISILVNTLNTSKIVIGKEFVKYADIVMDHIKGIVNCKALKYPASRVEIAASEIGEKAPALGAAMIPLKVLFGK